MGFILGMRARGQVEVAPPIRCELLLTQLGIETTGECNLEIYIIWSARDRGHVTKAD